MQNLRYTDTKVSIHCFSRIHINRTSCVADNPALNPTCQHRAPSHLTHPSGAAAAVCPGGSRGARPSCCRLLGPLSEVNTPLFPTTSQVPQLRGHPGSKVTCRARVLQGQPPGIQSQSTVLGCVHVGHLLPTLPCPLPRLPHPASVSSRFPWAKFPRTGGFCRGCPRVRVEKKDLAGLGGWMKGRHLAAHESNC